MNCEKDTYEIWSREGPGDSFHHVVDVVAIGHSDALDVYAEHAGGTLRHNDFLVRLIAGGSPVFKLFRLDKRPRFMEV
jgi:hypothetical protein